MKKVISFVLSVALCFATVACANESESFVDSGAKQQEVSQSPTSNPTEAQTNAPLLDSDDNAKILVEDELTDAEPTQGLHYEFTNTSERIYESLKKVYYQTLIEITNTGTETLYFGTQKYDLTDSSGKILKTGTLSSFPSILHPGEKGYFYDSVELSDTSIDSKVNLVPRWNIKTSKEDRIAFGLSEVEVREGNYGATVFGKITNDTGKEQKWAVISVFLYAKDGTPIGVWMTNVMEDMPIDVSFGFEISGIGSRTLYDEVTPDMVGSIEAYAYPPQYQ